MKLLRLVSIVMLSVCAVALGQSSDKPVASSDAQKSFDLMKTLAGTWQGPITTDDPAWSTDKPMSLSIRVAIAWKRLDSRVEYRYSRGHCILCRQRPPDVDSLLRFWQQATFDRAVIHGWEDGGVRPR